MKNTLRALFFFFIVGLGLSITASATPPTIPGRVVLKLRPGQTPAALEAALNTLNAYGLRQKFPHAQPPSPERPGSVDLRGIYQVELPAATPFDRAQAVLLSTKAVEYVEPLYIRKPLYQPNDPRADSTLTSLAASQYYLKQIRAYRAWDVSRGDSSMVIAITDGGVRLTHEDLRQQLKHNYADPVNGRDDDGDGYVDNFTGWDLANNDNDCGYDITIIHGSQVAGVAIARTDNGLGIAGLGNQCRFLPLNIYPNTPTGSFAGFEAVVYAADHGCQIINMSWGAPGGYSRFEQDAITYAAVNRDAVVVAAAGNTNADILFYPASYDHVLSVSGVTSTDQKSSSATFNYRVDLMAPGASILTTQGYHTVSAGGVADSDYGPVGGTSFAAPLAAGAAALVRSRFPQLTAAQVMARLRQTTDNIDGLPANAAWAGRLGTGRLNVLRALTADPVEARVVASTFLPARPTYAPGDTLRLAVDVQNLLLPLAGLTVTLTSLSPYVTVRQGSFAVGNMATLARATNFTVPFRLAVATSGIPLNTRATLRYRLTATGGFQYDQYVNLALNPDYVMLDANDLALTLTSRGNLAFDNLAGTLGAGLSYRAGDNMLSEGGLLLATTPTRVSDRLRTSGGQSRQSFFSLRQATRQQPGPRADQEARIAFQDTIPVAGSRVRSVGVAVRQRAYAWATPGRRDFIVLEYSLRNLTADTLKPLYAGIFADWDLPNANGGARNAAAYDTARALGYCYALGGPAGTTTPAVVYAGIRLLRGGAPAVYSIDGGAPAGTPIRLANGFSIAEKFLALSSGTARAQRTAGLPNGADVSQVVGTRLARLAPGDSTTVAFAVLAAPTLAQLQASADAAATVYATVLPTRPTTLATTDFRVYPNPTAGPLRVEVPADFGLAEVRVLNALGQVVRRQAAAGPLLDTQLGALPPGWYVVQAVGRRQVMSRAVMIQSR